MSSSNYLCELNKAMLWLAEQTNALFVGQAVKYPGQAAFKSFDGIPMEKRIEMPVAEEFQMGFCTGLALAGYLPISFYTRWDFLILAMNQLVNHLDKMPYMGYTPKVIIRTAIGRKTPLDPGPQHCQDHTDAVDSMLDTVKVYRIKSAEDVMPCYQRAMEGKGSAIIVEKMGAY